ncbi:HERV-H LTR-associating protein 1 [Eptesicus fuscus]|uniref:HERV-H LTR-associating protein 1 n=1 Tax=Eptesicus fuscus TaxID=29078 RepID=UPI002403E0CA|nr:HERV-H LTR-associating protein 1 [Eptesicus fuscus]
MPGFLVRGAAGRLRVGLACVLCLWNTVAAIKGEAKKETVTAFPLTTELPARAVDLSALNLTELVNDMLSRALKDSRKFFSLLSITSYSSFAFHKLSVAVYNISNLKTVDQAKFPTRYCYCLSNRTNDLSDFTALLVDIIGNSTSYLTEIFKSTSILSVSQTNASDCIFICVMTGKAGRNLSDFWELAEKSPVINYTFTSSLAAAPVLYVQSDTNITAARGTAAASKLTPTSQQTLPRTSPPRTARSTSVSALRASPWAEVPDPSEREQAVSTVGLPELLAKATVTATPGSVSPALPGSATSPAEAKDTGTTGSLSEPPARTHGSPSRTSPASGTPTPGTQTASPTKAPAPRFPMGPEISASSRRCDALAMIFRGHSPLERSQPRSLDPTAFTSHELDPPVLLQSSDLSDLSQQLYGATVKDARLPWCPQQLLRDGPVTAGSLPGAAHKLTPCLMELCRFFQQCLCASPRRDPRTEAMRYCLEYYSWFLKNATPICQKAKRVSHSHTLKQRCLENICKSV